MALYDNDSPTVYCRPKLNKDAYNKLVKNEEFSLFDMEVKADSKLYNDILSHISIFYTIQNANPEVDTFEVILKKRKTKNNWHKGFISPLTDEQMEKILVEYREDLKTFKVSQGAAKDVVNLLSDKLVNKVDVIRTEQRNIDSQIMYKKIDDFYKRTVCKYKG